MIVIGLLFVVLMFSSCSCSRSGSHLDDINYVTSFPLEIVLSEGEQVDLGKIGIMDIMIDDSLLFLSSQDANGLISVLDLNTGKDYGNYFKIGNGPGEFIIAPYFSRFERYISDTENGFLVNDGRGNILKWDLNSLGLKESADIKLYNNSLPPALFCVLYIKEGTLFCRELSEDGSRQNRYLLSHGEKIETESMKKLNSLTVPVKNDGYRHNILSTLSRYNREKGIIVEASIMMNMLHMYKLDGSFEKTICLGDELDNVYDIVGLDEKDLKETFTRVVLRDDFFAVMYSGGKQYPESLDDIPNPRIFLFDWSGNPLAKISLNERASVFDIDMNHKTMYTLDRDFEVIRRYDLSELFSRVK